MEMAWKLQDAEKGRAKGGEEVGPSDQQSTLWFWQMEADGGVYSLQMLPTDDQRHDRFLRLYSEHEPALRGFVRSLVPTRDDAREVMQEVAVVLWQKFGALAGDGNFRPWAFSVARYEVLAWRRDRARDRHVFDEAALALLAGQTAQMGDRLDAQRDALEECLQKLPPEQRALVNAAYAAGARIDRLAAQSGRTAMALVEVFAVDTRFPDCRVTVTLAQPAALYVLRDARLPEPPWLRERFTDTGIVLRLELAEGVSAPFDERWEKLFAVWKAEVREAGPVTFEPRRGLDSANPRSTYALAAKALPAAGAKR
jgi:RNA polymerase sigma-70 factor (ECF subfamily)